MKIQAINNQQPVFQAINKKYYDWAVKETRIGFNYGELMRVLEYDVNWRIVPAQDAIDTLNAIRNNLAPRSWDETIQRSIDYISRYFLK